MRRCAVARRRTGRARGRAAPGTAARSGPAAGPRRRRRARLPLLPRNSKRRRRALRRRRAGPQGRQPERAVAARVLGVADADQRGLEEAHDRGEDLLPGKPGRARSAVDARAERRQPLGEGEQPAVLGLVADLAPARVIAVLLAALGVAAHRLDMPVRCGANPHLGPRGRDHQGANATPRGEIPDGGPVCRSVAEALPTRKRVIPGCRPSRSEARPLRRLRRLRPAAPQGWRAGFRARDGGRRTECRCSSHADEAEQARCQGGCELGRVARMTSRRQDDDSAIVGCSVYHTGREATDARLDRALSGPRWRERVINPEA